MFWGISNQLPTRQHLTEIKSASNGVSFYFLQVENYITRPLSCEGPSDSGVSVSSEYICPDGDSSSLTAQSQSVSVLLSQPWLKTSQMLSFKLRKCFKAEENNSENWSIESVFPFPDSTIEILFIYSLPQDIESHRLKRGHVLAELLETERIYVNEMKSILTVGFIAFFFCPLLFHSEASECHRCERVFSLCRVNVGCLVTLRLIVVESRINFANLWNDFRGLCNIHSKNRYRES